MTESDKPPEDLESLTKLAKSFADREMLEEARRPLPARPALRARQPRPPAQPRRGAKHRQRQDLGRLPPRDAEEALRESPAPQRHRLGPLLRSRRPLRGTGQAGPGGGVSGDRRRQGPGQPLTSTSWRASSCFAQQALRRGRSDELRRARALQPVRPPDRRVSSVGSSTSASNYRRGARSHHRRLPAARRRRPREGPRS